MMGLKEWKGQISINLKEEYKEKLEKHKEEFRDRKPTHELYNRMDRIIENSPSPEERAEKHRKKAQEHEEKAENWEKKAQIKDAKSNLRENKEELDTVESQINELESKGIKSREEIEKELLDKWRGRGRFDDDASEEKIKEEVHFDRQVKKRLEKQPDLEELKERKQNLKEDIQEYEQVLEE